MNFYRELHRLWIRYIAKRNPLLERIDEKTKFTKQYLRYLNDNYPSEEEFRRVPKVIRDFLKQNGWEEVSSSSRCVYVKDGEILKLAVDGFGVVQNLQESKVFRMRNWKLSKPHNLDIPKVYFTDKTFGFIVSERIWGDHELPPERIMNFVYKELDCGDLHEYNWKKSGRKWYLIDTGCAYKATGL